MVKQRQPLEKLLTLVMESTFNLSEVLIIEDINELIFRYKELEENKDDLLKLDPESLLIAKEILAIQEQINIVRTRIIS